MNSREQRKEYIAEQLQDLRYIYRDPDTKVSLLLSLYYFRLGSSGCNVTNVSFQAGAYCSSAILEIFAVHQQIVAKTDEFLGYPAVVIIRGTQTRAGLRDGYGRVGVRIQLIVPLRYPYPSAGLKGY
jgi:hypothetical protein